MAAAVTGLFWDITGQVFGYQVITRLELCW
jgi:hypothetical protein